MESFAGSRAVRLPPLVSRHLHRPTTEKVHIADTDRVEVDYSKDCLETYTAVARRLIENSDIHRVFDCAIHHGNDDEDHTWPSWVPEWTRHGVDSPRLDFMQGSLRISIPSKHSEYRHERHPDHFCFGRSDESGPASPFILNNTLSHATWRQFASTIDFSPCLDLFSRVPPASPSLGISLFLRNARPALQLVRRIFSILVQRLSCL